MDNQPTTQTVNVTNRYDQFRIIGSNRDVVENHVQRIIASIEENGNFISSTPILVNENMEVIDGQHRLEACRRLEQMVFYTVVPGLTIQDARNMNILHRGWQIQDYLKSYVQEGRQAYLDINQLHEEFPTISITAIIMFYEGGQRTGYLSTFHRGDLPVADINVARDRLSKLKDLLDITDVFSFKPGQVAFLKVISNENYDHDRMVNKVRQLAPTMSKYATVGDSTRQLENVYNYGRSQANYTRFF